MNKEELKQYLSEAFPSCNVEETFDFPLLWVNKEEVLSVCNKLYHQEKTLFDFLFCETAIDRGTHFEMVYHLTSQPFATIWF